jgi:hypothetical protein
MIFPEPGGGLRKTTGASIEMLTNSAADIYRLLPFGQIAQT